MQSKPPVQGIVAALLTPVFLGMAPIFGKLANQAGADPFTVAAVRTLIAVAILWLTYAIFMRKFIFIYPAGLSGCVIIGTINGIGSLFYYGGLNLLDASLTQLINGLYLVFALLLTRIGGEKITARVLIRGLLALLALIIITGGGTGTLSGLGVGLMLGSALMFAGTVVFSQYVLFEMPAPTAALYILTTMAVIVTMAWLPSLLPSDSGEINLANSVEHALFMDVLAQDGAAGESEIAQADEPQTVDVGKFLVPIFWLGLTTALGRLMLFAGVKFMGSLQTAVTALAEIGVALLLAYLVLGETLTPMQWLGVIILGSSLLLIRQEDLRAQGFNPNSLLVANMASLQFQKIAFHRAFGDPNMDDEFGTMGAITTMEIVAIRDMMGVDNKPVDPFPIVKMQKGLEERDGGFSVNLQEFLDNYDGEEG